MQKQLNAQPIAIKLSAWQLWHMLCLWLTQRLQRLPRPRERHDCADEPAEVQHSKLTLQPAMILYEDAPGAYLGDLPQGLVRQLQRSLRRRQQLGTSQQTNIWWLGDCR